MTARLTLEYLGTPFAGWAEQPGARTVAAELRVALETVLRMPVALTAAGRTDRGVHALGQVVSYVGPLPRLRSVNAVLPDEIVVLDAQEVPDGFDARHDAQSRSYRYRVLTRSAPSPYELDRALWWPRPLDEDVLHVCAAALVGRHDFSAFTPSEGYHHSFERRVLQAAWSREGDILAFEIEAHAFLRGMVRILVGTMLEAARGERDPDAFAALLAGAPRAAAGATARPHGLYLTSVRYEP